MSIMLPASTEVPRHTFSSHSEAPSPRDLGVVYVLDQDPNSASVYRIATTRSRADKVRFCESTDAFLNAVDPRRPGCLVYRLHDDGAPESSGDTAANEVRQLQRQMSALGFELPIVVTTDATTFTTAAELMENGVLTVVQHPPTSDRLSQYIDAALQEDRTRLELRDTYHQLTSILRRLSDRQRKVLELAKSGTPNKKIAAVLDVSIRTIEVERSRIMRAFQSRSIADITRRIGELRMLSLWHSHWRFSRPRLRINRAV